MRYCFCDFETTWLDRKKDEPIQIWLILCDEKMQYIDSFVSYIRPQKPREQLREVVQHLTNLSLDDVVWAPTIDDIQPQIQHFFDEETVLIWHNVSFDLSFLSRIGEYALATSCDTYVFSQYLIPYANNYSLSGLVQEKNIASYAREKELSRHEYSEDAHDALHDCVLSARLRWFLLDRMSHCDEKFDCQTILSCLPDSEKRYRPRISVDSSKISQKCILPSLSRPLPSKQLNDASWELPKSWFYTVKNQAFEDVLREILKKEGKKTIIFHQRDKATLARSLATWRWYDVGHLFPDQYRDMSQLALLLKKLTLTIEEVLFVYWWCTHALLGLSVIDLRRPLHHLLYHLARVSKESDTVLRIGTHSSLYHRYHEEPQDFTDDNIVFFDADWRYHTINQYKQWQIHLFDLNIWDKTLYRLHTEHKSKEYSSLLACYNEFLVFLWTLGISLKKPMQHRKMSFSDRDYHKSLYDNVFQLRNNCISSLRNDEVKQWKSYRDNMDRLWEWEHSLYTHVDQDHYITYSLRPHIQYTDFSEFTDFLPHSQTRYLSLLQEDKPIFLSTPEKKPPVLSFTRNQKRVLDTLVAWKTYFIFSWKKDASHDLFRFLYTEKKTDHILVAENITWWIKKNLQQAKIWPSIIIWWYNSLANTFSGKITIDIFIGFAITWSLQQHIVADFMFYGWYNAQTSSDSFLI